MNKLYKNFSKLSLKKIALTGTVAIGLGMTTGFVYCQANRNTLLFNPYVKSHKFLSECLIKIKNIDATDDGHYTALHLAIRKNDAELVRTLIKNGADVNIASGESRAWSPLYYAVSNNNFITTKLLINAGANVNVVSGECPLWSPLHHAVNNNNFSITDLLINSGANVKIITREPRTSSPLHHAVNNNNFGIVKLLINAGADIIWTPIINDAVYNNNIPMVKLLIEKGASLLVGNKHRDLLGYSIFYGHTKMALFLIDEGLPIDLEIFLKAVNNSNLTIVQRIIDDDNFFNNINLDADDCKNILLACVVSACDKNSLPNKIKILKLLIKKGIRADNIILHAALDHNISFAQNDDINRSDIIKILLKNGATFD